MTMDVREASASVDVPDPKVILRAEELYVLRGQPGARLHGVELGG
jgi:hypothetical protein